MTQVKILVLATCGDRDQSRKESGLDKYHKHDSGNYSCGNPGEEQLGLGVRKLASLEDKGCPLLE